MADKQLTVLQVLPALESGGVERGTLEVAEALVQAGHRSIVISAGGRLVDKLVAGGSEHVHLQVGRKTPFTLLQVRPLRKILRKEHVDILHVRSRMPAWIAWLAWRGIPEKIRPHFVTTVHGLYSVNRYSAIMMQGEKVIAVSDTARQYILDNYPDVDPQRIVTIHRGVDRKAFPFGYRPDNNWLSAWNADYPILKGRRVLTLPGRLTRLKGHEIFIKLVSALVGRGLDVHGLIVGHLEPSRRAYVQELQALIASLGIAGRITFTGRRDDIREIYAVSNLVLSLSRKPESFGRTVLEPLRMGRPTAGCDYGGVGEILGRIYPQGRLACADMGVLVKQVAHLLEQPEPVAETDDFTLDRMLSDTLELYGQLAGCRQADVS